nr:uncharacterized protein LOC117835226 [Setaria viridis]
MPCGVRGGAPCRAGRAWNFHGKTSALDPALRVGEPLNQAGSTDSSGPAPPAPAPAAGMRTLSYTNRGLTVVNDVLLLAEEDPFPLLPAASPASHHLDSAGASRSLWPPSAFRCCSSSAAPAAGPAPRGGVDLADGRSRSRVSCAGVPDKVAALSEVWDELDLVRPAGVSVLHEIALRMVRAGCTKELFRAFANAACDVLYSFSGKSAWYSGYSSVSVGE